MIITSDTSNQKLFRWFDFNDPIVSNNLYLSKGILASPSIVNNPGFQNTFFITATGQNRAREEIFEDIRSKRFFTLPSRRSALWLFDDALIAQECGYKWNFVKQGRDLIEVEIIHLIKMIKVDSQWINCVSPDFEQNAIKYWSGYMSPEPKPEILFEGVIKLLGETWMNKCKQLDPKDLKY